MTTHNSHHDQSDVDASVVEPSSAPDAIVASSASDSFSDASSALSSSEQGTLTDLTETAPSSLKDEQTTITDFVQEQISAPEASSASEQAEDASAVSSLPEAPAFSDASPLSAPNALSLSSEESAPPSSDEQVTVLSSELASSTSTELSTSSEDTLTTVSHAEPASPVLDEQSLPFASEPLAPASVAESQEQPVIPASSLAIEQSSSSASSDVLSESVSESTGEFVQPEASSSSLSEEELPINSEAPIVEEIITEEAVFPYASILSFADPKSEEVRSFSDFIEEFRQSEALQEAHVDFSLLAPSPSDDALPTEIFSARSASEHSEVQKPDAAISPSEALSVDTTSTPSVKPDEDLLASKIEPPTPTPITRVSPLLRPASRLRLPRHTTRHHREEPVQETLPAPLVVEPPAPAAPVAPEKPAEIPAAPAAEQPRPARRYRFDRPAASTTSTTPPSTRSTSTGQSGSSHPVSPLRNEEVRDKEPGQSRIASPLFGSFGRTDSARVDAVPVEEVAAQQQEAPVLPLASAKNAPIADLAKPSQDQKSTESTRISPIETNETGRRRHHQDRQQKEPQAPDPVVSSTAPTVHPATDIVLPAESVPAASVSPEDLPPLEYSDLQKANPRRRRRHRNGSAANGNGVVQGSPEAPAAQSPLPQSNGVPAFEAPAAPVPAEPAPVAPAARIPVPPSVTELNSQVNPFTIVSGYTVSQMNQGNEVTGPFMGPEPSPARGSVVSRDGRTTRAEMQRSTAYPPAVRTASHEGAPSASSLNHLANVVSQSIQQSIQLQTDRMVTELRRANQAPTSVSVSLPPFPSTERVGVFVDVANLLYSARTLRIAVDFGKLLDFLRGNRRLVRAHAYCPTSPQAGDEQMFLQAVKGLGYRITTKNYKTFSSGAKKADLDLDLCMDVVRLVDGRAVDCIVLVSGDSDFMPMLDYCSDHGVRVEVAAFDEAMSATLRQSCDLFVNLSMLEEIRS